MISKRYFGILAFSLILIIAIFIAQFSYLQNQGSVADLSVTSANVQTDFNSSQGMYDYNNISYVIPLYMLNITLHIKFNGQMHFNNYAALSVCSFSLNLTSSNWHTEPIICSGPTCPCSETFSGSYNFSLSFMLHLDNYTIDPIPLSFSVYSSIFNMASSNYLLNVGRNWKIYQPSSVNG